MIGPVASELLKALTTLVVLLPDASLTTKLPHFEVSEFDFPHLDTPQVSGPSHLDTMQRMEMALQMQQKQPKEDQDADYRVFFQTGKSEKDLPVCSPWSVCSKVDTYATPWVERQCRCPGDRTCSTDISPDDGHTITDKTRQFKVCEPSRKLPKCRFFRDVTWTFITYPDNVTQQVMHCVCPKNSVAYIIKRQAYRAVHGVGFQYSFACSPQSRLRCQRKEPCRLFTVKKRTEIEEVNTNTLCRCPHAHTCPQHHLDAGVIPGKTYTEDSVRTYSGYCM
ncbi:protein argos [Oratosquilla oratoria]|uniref:protein argos n=1 Tax=Oratosquilla oratoria TaxID=337810 RepID=UPI003F7683AC